MILVKGLVETAYFKYKYLIKIYIQNYNLLIK